jgi:chondroitin AC lyase
MKQLSHHFKNWTMSMFFVVSLIWTAPCTAQEFDQIVRRVDSLQRAGAMNATMDYFVTTYLPTLQSDGSWGDLNYSDNSASFPSLAHISSRVMNFALAYTNSVNQYYQNSGLYAGILKSLRFWYTRNPQSSNWYDNQVNCPTALGRILSIMRQANQGLPQSLEDSLINGRMESSYFNPPSAYTGSNIQVVAYHFAISAALLGNSAKLTAATNAIYDAVVISAVGTEGLQYDNSFLQHETEQMIGTYGNAFAATSYGCAVVFSGTSYQMPTTKRNLLSGFYKDTYLKTIRGRYFDFNVLGRGIASPGTSTPPISVINHAKMVDPANTATWNAVLARFQGTQQANYQAPSGHKHYWLADYDLHLRPGYMFSTFLVSTRTRRVESINGENLLGKFLSDGATNIRRRGDEYQAIAPVWEWDKIPGVTSRDYATDAGSAVPNAGVYSPVPGSTRFAGGATDSTYAVAALDLNFDGVTGKKAWFHFDNEIVCLGAGIRSAQAENITTTVNQSWLRGNVVLSENGNQTTLTASSVANVAPAWVLHDSTGYFFPSGGNVSVSNVTQTGNWRPRINTMGNISNAIISQEVFKLWFNHGQGPTDGKYAYIVVPNLANASSVAAYSTSDIEILANSDSIQAVKHAGLHILQTAFHKAGSIVDASSGTKVQVDKPAVTMVQNVGQNMVYVTVADPTQQLVVINLAVTFPGAATAINKKVTLPSGNFKGSSISFSVYVNDVSDPVEQAPDTVALFTRTPLADAYVRDGAYAGTNYGANARLIVKKDGADYARESFLKFDLHGLPTYFSKTTARLRLYRATAGPTADMTGWKLYKVTDNGWTEGGLIWNNMPGAGILIDSVAGATGTGYTEFDISSIFTGMPSDSMVSFKLVSTVQNQNAYVEFSSREAAGIAQRPVIMLEPFYNVFQSAGPVDLASISNWQVHDGTAWRMPRVGNMPPSGFAKSVVIRDGDSWQNTIAATSVASGATVTVETSVFGAFSTINKLTNNGVIKFSGTAAQTIPGQSSLNSGSWGNVVINNPAGVKSTQDGGNFFRVKNIDLKQGVFTAEGKTGLSMYIDGVITAGSGKIATSIGGGGTTYGIYMSGGSAQQIPAGIFLNDNVQRLNIANASGVTLQGPLTVGGNLVFSAGKLILASGDLSVRGTIAGTDAGKFIVTPNTAGLRLAVGTVAKAFPIGPSTGSYTPLSIINTGTEDYFTARVRNLLAGLPISDPDKVIPLVWELAEQQAGGSNVKLTFQWNASDAASAPGFSVGGGSHVIGHFMGSGWQQQATTIAGSGPFTTQSIQPYATFSPFVIAMDSAFNHAPPFADRINFTDGQLIPMQDEGGEGSLNAYPNPSVSVLNVSHPAAGSKASLSIIGPDGRLFRTATVPQGSVRSAFDVTALPPGSYLLRFQDQGKILVSRFIR